MSSLSEPCQSLMGAARGSYKIFVGVDRPWVSGGVPAWCASGVCDEQDALAQEADAGAACHLPFAEFQVRDPSLSDARAVGQRRGRGDRVKVVEQPGGVAAQLGNAAGVGPGGSSRAAGRGAVGRRGARGSG